MSRFLPFTEARKFARNLGLRSSEEWHRYSKSGQRPKNIPASPGRTYRDNGWVGMRDWLGSEAIPIRSRAFLPFNEAREFARSLGLKSEKEWFDYARTSGQRPANIPIMPRYFYKGKGWTSVNDWLGGGRTVCHSANALPFEEAREFARSLRLKNQDEWYKYTKSGEKPDNIPIAPSHVYKGKGWVNWQDWHNYKAFLPFEEAREFARSLGLRSSEEWHQYARSGQKPKDIPFNPNQIYKDKGYTTIFDWLGQPRFIPFEEAREFARSLGFKNQNEWYKYAKSKQKPRNIPSNPKQVYKGRGWAGWKDWHGRA